MTTAAPPELAAMMQAAEVEWRVHSCDDWTTIDFRRWPRGFHRSAWVVASYISWNPLDVLERPTPAARGVNVLLTRLCITFTMATVTHTADPCDPAEPLLAWFNVAVNEHKHDIAASIERLGDVEWGLPASHRQAARRLVKMWDSGGVAAFGDLSVAPTPHPHVAS